MKLLELDVVPKRLPMSTVHSARDFPTFKVGLTKSSRTPVRLGTPQTDFVNGGRVQRLNVLKRVATLIDELKTMDEELLKSHESFDVKSI